MTRSKHFKPLFLYSRTHKAKEKMSSFYCSVKVSSVGGVLELLTKANQRSKELHQEGREHFKPPLCWKN